MVLLTAGNTGVLSGQKTREVEQSGGFVRICEILQDTRRWLASSLLGNGWAMKIPGRSGGRFGNAGRMADGAYSSEDGRQNGTGYLFITNHFGKSEYLQRFSHSQIAANYHFVQLSRQLWRILRFSMQSIFAADSMGWGCCPGLSAVGYSGRCCPAGALSISGAGADGPGLVVAGGEGFFYRWMGGVAEKEGVGQERGIGYVPHIPSSLP